MRHGEHLLFDFHSFPLRIVEVPERPQEGLLKMNALDSIYGRSMGGIAPSGWPCEHLPYLVELDNWAVSKRPGQPGLGGCWVWGYDEMSWFAHQDKAYRNQWLRYAWSWVRQHDPNGHFQLPGSRVLHAPVAGQACYFANTKSQAVPTGFGQEQTIQAIWAEDEGRATEYRVTDTLLVDKVPSWFPVGFCLLTHGQQQYVAYYDQEHQLVVARRQLDQRTWHKVALPSKIGWDSHNYVTMAIDSAGHLHLAGNMHCVPLNYFRTERPGDISTFRRLPMTGQEEQRCTYPRFLHGADGRLLFTYRSGGSGNGRRFYNVYDVEGKRWALFLDGPLFEGEGQRNAYPQGPIKGPDGLFHLVWVWRDTPDCATNHHLSYARSRDLRHWETAAGQAVQLPLTLGQSQLCVDPIPPGGGIINGCQRLAFDRWGHPMISYHKLDENGHMQIYVTRFRDGQWHRRPITAWQENITFSGRGAMPFIGIRISGLEHVEPNLLSIRYRHRDHGTGHIFLDEQTLQPREAGVADLFTLPPQLTVPTIPVEGISVKLADDVGSSDQSTTKYVLRWETLGAHHDRPRQPPLPPASTLELVELQR
jgi:hypothetical protein